MPKNRRKISGTKVFFTVWIVLTMIFLFFPIAQIILMSFNTSVYGRLPIVFTTQWYVKLFTTSKLLGAAGFSLGFSLIVSLVSAVLGIMASLALRKFPTRLNNIFNTLMDVPLMIPWLVQAVSLLLLFSFVGIGRSIPSMFLGCLAAVMPHSFMLTYSRVMTMDPYPEEAGRTLGATPFQVFRDITFRMIFPAVLAGWLMSFVLCFNCFSLQYYLAPFGTYTLPMKIFTLIRSGSKPDMNALATIMVGITFAIILILNKIGFGADQLFGAPRRGEKE